MKLIRVRPGRYSDGEWSLCDIRRDPGETRSLDDKVPERVQPILAQCEQYAQDNGLVSVAENWSPWRGFLRDDGKPLDDQMAAAEAASEALESVRWPRQPTRSMVR